MELNFSLNQEVTTFPSLKNMTAYTSTWRQLVEQIRSSAWVDATLKFREAKKNEKKKEADRIKQNQPIFMAVARFKNGRKFENLTQMLHTVFVDIDHVPEEELKRITTLLKSDPHVVLFYRTISGEGLRVIILVDHISVESYEAVFTMVNRHYASRLGFTYDEVCKDVTRTSVLCHDAEAFCQENPKPLHIELPSGTPPAKAVKQKKEAVKQKKSSPRPVTLSEMDFTCRRLARRSGKSYTAGKRNEFINHWTFLMASHGAERERVTNLALDIFADHDADNTRSIIKSIYENPKIKRDVPFERVPMQVCDMEFWLNEHYEIRYNTILRNVQLRTLHEKLRKQPDDDTWEILDDRLENEIWRQMQADGINFRIGDVRTLLLSKFPTEFDPLLTYLEGLPLWDGHTDYISLLADTVRVKSDQEFWRKMFQNFLVGMMDCYFTPGRANELMLIFLGSQGCYKTTWMEHLLPPELSEYYASYVQTDTFGKDDIIRLTNCLIINFDELEMQNSVQQNRLKALISLKDGNLRRTYARNTEIIKRIASFVGSSNNMELLNDVTGNRRFFPVEVESIDAPFEHPVDYAGVYSQAYALWKAKTRYWLNEEERKQLDKHNARFMSPNLERDLINAYYRVPQPEDDKMPLQYRPHFVNTAQILAHVSAGIHIPINPIRVGQVMKELGFKKKHTKVGAMYLVVERTATDMRNIITESEG